MGSSFVILAVILFLTTRRTHYKKGVAVSNDGDNSYKQVEGTVAVETVVNADD